MKTINFPKVAVLAVTVLLNASNLSAQEVNKDERTWGSLSVGAETYFNGRRDSAKFEEYREIPNGTFGDVELNYENNRGYHFEVDAEKIAQDDEMISLNSGDFGVWNLELEHNRIPHRYAYGISTLYSDTGSGRLELQDNLQTQLQNITSLSDAAAVLNAAETSAFIRDLEVRRTRERATFDFLQCEPFQIRGEVKRDERNGTRPMGGSFGLNNAVEIFEPRKYETMEYSLTGEYSDEIAYLSANYYASVFNNRLHDLVFDNPFRITDSTSPTAYLNPTGFGPAFANNGASRGLIDLAPDNWYQSVSFNGALKDLPWRSRLTGTLSFGWMRQDDTLNPYTTNTAISPASGAPFNAFTTEGLPVRKADAAVDTSLFDVSWTGQPAESVDGKIFYRYYERQNDTERITLPGFVVFDATWEEGELENHPNGYNQNTTGIDVGVEVAQRTRLGAAYTYERMHRTFREVDNTHENTFELSLDNRGFDLATFRVAWQHGVRDISGGYNPAVGLEEGAVISQLPFLRKYDEADRVKDSVNLLATAAASETVDLTGSFIYGRSDYDESDFGLLEDDQQVYSIDASYAPSNELAIHAFYSYEEHNADQRDRQWVPGGIGDPFFTEPGFDSNSNWKAELTDKVNTVGGGFDIGIIPKVLTFRAGYSLSYANGEVEPSSPVGAPVNDTNPFTPKKFKQVDDITIQSVIPQLIWDVRKNLAFVLGYLWERYDVSDYNRIGYRNVPTTPTGAYNGALLNGSLYALQDYEVNLAFARIDYRF